MVRAHHQWPQFVTMDRRRQICPEAAHALAASVNRLDYGLFVLSKQSEVLFASRKARQWLDVQRQVRLRDHVLLLEKRPIVEELCKIPAVAAGIHALRVDAAMARGGRQGRQMGGSLVLTAQSGSRDGDDAAILHTLDPDSSEGPSALLLRALYGLTAAEGAVACHLHAGASLSVVAAQLSISVATVRSHLKRIYMKCSVNSQAKLVRLLSMGPRL